MREEAITSRISTPDSSAAVCPDVPTVGTHPPQRQVVIYRTGMVLSRLPFRERPVTLSCRHILAAPQGVQQGLHVGWRRRLELERCSGPRMGKTKPGGMQRLAREIQ